MNHNAAHHANIALHMFLTNDYVHLIDQGKDYLDKPHLLFWLAAIAYHFFGVTSFAYKFFSFLFAMGGIYSVYRLAQLVLDAKAGQYAALIFASSFAFVLSTNDVRMDAMVVSCIAFSTWQLFDYFFNSKRFSLLLGALGLALGFSTKGMVAIVLPVMTVVLYFLQQRRIRQVLTIRWVYLALVTMVFLFPVFYCFYLQFDLHPEKEVRGVKGNSGIMFLLIGQSFQRYSGSGWGTRSSDPFFLVHTFLWAFLPWSFIAYIALFKNIKEWWQAGLRLHSSQVFAFTGTTFFIFLLLSFSRFKNAHYVNILFPYFSIITAHYFLTVNEKYVKTIYWIQLCISIFLMAGIGFISVWAFAGLEYYVIAGATILLAIFIFIAVQKKVPARYKILWLSFASMVFCFFLLNFHFYPNLLTYQSGHVLAKRIKEKRIDPKKLYYLENSDKSYSMEFSLQTLVPTITLDSLIVMPKPVYLFGTDAQVKLLKERLIAFDTALHVDHYNVSTLKYKFLNPTTRNSMRTPHYVLKINANR